jgi:hypothetical protein
MPDGKEAVGYVQATPGTTAATLNQYKVKLEQWAHANGYRLVEPVFIDRNFGSSRAFDALLTAVHPFGATHPSVVILPHPRALAPSDGERIRKQAALELAGLETVVMS